MQPASPARGMQGHGQPGQAAAGQRSGQQHLPTGFEAKGKNVKSWLNTCI